MTGGTKKMITVVSQADYNNALGQLKEVDLETGEDSLWREFGDIYLPFKTTLETERGDVKSSPAVGEEIQSGQKAKLTREVKFTAGGVEIAAMQEWLSGLAEKKIGEGSDQIVYDNGMDALKLGTLSTSGDGGKRMVKLVATVRIGPDLNGEQIRQELLGMNYGEVQRKLASIKNVRDVDVKFSYPWVFRIPNQESRLKIEIKVDE